jgi:moderate conductance mechanosensitive channel
MAMPNANMFQGFTVRLPDGTNWNVEVGGLLGTIATTLVIVAAAALAVRLAHIVIRGALRTLMNRDEEQGTVGELTAAELRKRQDTIETLAVNFVRFFVFVIAGLMILETTFRLDIGPAIAGLGIAGIAVGLGTQHLVRDYLNGALILIENQYARGDVVNIAGIGGVVEDFTLRRTTLRDLNGTVHTVPNGEITIASNLTRAWARVNEQVQVVYGTDVARVTRVIDQLGHDMADDPEWGPQILEAPHVERVNELGEHGIVLLVLGKVRAASQWSAAGEFRRRLLVAFSENGISMPQGVIISGPNTPTGRLPAED